MMLSRLACILIRVYAPQVAATQPAATARHGDSGVVRVLVTEDAEGLGEVQARGLREQGYVVDLMPDGETAAAYLGFYLYEVAVLDWRMPRLSGPGLVRRLRRDGTATPMLMLTAREAPADRITGLDAAADDYLVKPNEADAFGSNTIDVHLARLRSKLAGAGPRIETVRGVGYRIVAS
jgi:DNA-binding response OmpR family regulator